MSELDYFDSDPSRFRCLGKYLMNLRHSSANTLRISEDSNKPAMKCLLEPRLRVIQAGNPNKSQSLTYKYDGIHFRITEKREDLRFSIS